MKKIVSALLALIMVLGMAACGAAPAPAPTEAPAPAVDTVILMEADKDMLNTYSVIAVNPDAPFVDADGKEIPDVYVNTAGADDGICPIYLLTGPCAQVVPPYVRRHNGITIIILKAKCLSLRKDFYYD